MIYNVYLRDIKKKNILLNYVYLVWKEVIGIILYLYRYFGKIIIIYGLFEL